MIKIPLTPAARALAVALLVPGGPAAADPPHARAAEAAAAATHGDWRLGCDAGACAIRTVVRGGGGAEVLELAATGPTDAARLTVRTPLPLLLPDGALLGLGADPARTLAWRTCADNVCEAEAAIDPDLLAGLKRERAAEVTLTLADGVRIRLPASLMGFSAAWRALEAAAPATPP